ncbi:MAG: Gfo/Idh/MocA family oxidoreductase [Armatimonadota bacterium]|nr:MAG: Gfo/Idh/MocA family oxidoreductase [Armatimonadota bacterium]
MAKKVKLGLIGCGGIMSMHVDQLEPVKAAKIVGLADTSKAMMGRFLKRHPHLERLPSFRDYRDLIAEVEMDGVIIATPHTLHYEHIMTCLDRGLHVLAEKPMVCTTAHAKSVIRKAKQTGLILMLAYQRHFYPAFRYARELVADGKIGRVTFVQGLQAQEWLRGTRGTWRQDPKLSGGGQLNDSASHLLDVTLWVTDLVPDTVYAAVNNRGTKVDILSGLTVQFKGGAIGSLAVVGDAPRWWEEITFYGEQGALYVRDGRLTLQTAYPKSKTKNVTDRRRYRGDADKNFVDSILGRDEPQTPPIWGLRVIQLTEAAWESARTGKPAKVKR